MAAVGMGIQLASHSYNFLRCINTPLAQYPMLVVCSGWLTANVKEEFKAEINGLIPETKRVVLDLSNVAFMDSSGLGALVGLYVTARRAGVELQLVNLSQRVRELLGMTNLLSVFETCGQYIVRMP